MLRSKKWYRSLFIRSLGLSLLLLCLTSCSSFNPLDLVSKGVNTAANVQAGATNSQTVGTTQVTDQTVRNSHGATITQTRDDTKVKSETVETVVVNEINPLLFGTLILAFIVWSYFLYKLPSPDQIWKKKNN